MTSLNNWSFLLNFYGVCCSNQLCYFPQYMLIQSVSPFTSSKWSFFFLCMNVSVNIFISLQHKVLFPNMVVLDNLWFMILLQFPTFSFPYQYGCTYLLHPFCTWLFIYDFRVSGANLEQALVCLWVLKRESTQWYRYGI